MLAVKPSRYGKENCGFIMGESRKLQYLRANKICTAPKL